MLHAAPGARIGRIEGQRGTTERGRQRGGCARRDSPRGCRRPPGTATDRRRERRSRAVRPARRSGAPPHRDRSRRSPCRADTGRDRQANSRSKASQLSTVTGSCSSAGSAPRRGATVRRSSRRRADPRITCCRQRDARRRADMADEARDVRALRRRRNAGACGVEFKRHGDSWQRAPARGPGYFSITMPSAESTSSSIATSPPPLAASVGPVYFIGITPREHPALHRACASSRSVMVTPSSCAAGPVVRVCLIQSNSASS